MKVNWNSQPAPQTLLFDDLQVNDTFRLQHGEAIYTKVQFEGGLVVEGKGHRQLASGMLEIATGKVFAPSLYSKVIPVEVEINVGVRKPSIYG